MKPLVERVRELIVDLQHAADLKDLEGRRNAAYAAINSIQNNQTKSFYKKSLDQSYRENKKRYS